MKMSHRAVSGLIRTLTIIGIASVAFADRSAAAAQRIDLKPLRIEVPGDRNLQFINLWVAVGAGFFHEEGLAPEIEVASEPRTVGNMLLKGDADVALLPPPMYLGMMAESKPIQLFASLLANEPINLVVRKDIADARGLSARASLRERMLAIKGLKIGLAGEVAPRLRAIATRAGMDSAKDFQLTVVPGPAQVKAFADKRVDALFAHTPYLETALVDYGGVLLVQTSGGEVPELADGQIHALATTQAEAKNKPELIAAVTRAIYRAEQLIHSDPKATVEALIASGVAKDRQMLEATAAVYGPAVPQTPKISLAGIERDVELYPAHPRAPDFTRVRLADFVAAQFAEQAVAAKR